MNMTKIESLSHKMHLMLNKYQVVTDLINMISPHLIGILHFTPKLLQRARRRIETHFSIEDRVQQVDLKIT